MLLTKLDRNIVQTTWRYLSTYVITKNTPRSICPHYNFAAQPTTNLKLLRTTPCSHKRNYSTGSQNYDILPPLTDNPKILWPSFFKSCGNFVRCNFVIKPYMDSDFNMPEFVDGAKEVQFITLFFDSLKIFHEFE